MVEPTIYTGDPITGYGADTTRRAFQKYNQHTHPQVLSSFLFEPVDVGDTVELMIDGEDALTYQGVPNTPEIVSVQANYLEVTTQATRSGVGTLTVAGTHRYHNIEAVQGSNQIQIYAVAAGFISPTTQQAALHRTYQGTADIDTSSPLQLTPQELTDLMAVLSMPPLSLPVQAIPIVLSSPKLRLTSLHLLPQWEEDTDVRGVTFRLASNHDTFEYLTDAISLNQTGRYSISLTHKLIKPGAALYLQIFNPQKLARLSYQLDAITV